MYKIYINHALLLLSPAPETLEGIAPDRRLAARYSGKKKTLLNYVDMMEKGRRFDCVNIFYPDVELLFQDFCAHHRIIEAAGGIVYNPQGELLFIYRLGHWDLPKGKIDEGETPEEAALREVREETGLLDVQSEGFALTTYHTYRDRDNRRVLKPSHWFRMRTAQKTLHLQTEENIEDAAWMLPKAFFEKALLAYPSIYDVTRAELSQIKT